MPLGGRALKGYIRRALKGYNRATLNTGSGQCITPPVGKSGDPLANQVTR